ncbi:DUF6786 family protein [Winogradskyella schleiferi]|uniref:DUF6786 family protein n=1 Tax=Winogradskyella schleiferi TaxID=2686078 RepID=UPI0015B7D3B2|nr:DUF6786 family protein [Winogradskyella schleiferi]
MKNILIFTVTLTMVLACKEAPKQPSQMEAKTYEKGSFAYDETFLKKQDAGLIVLQQDSSKVIVSAKYQAKVFTSTVDGNEGKTLGWVNYDAFGKQNAHMNAYGGENRFWLGPEGNVFSLYFKPKAEMTFENWKTPAPIDTEPWTVNSSNNISVTLEKQMQLKNYADSDFNIKAVREISILDKSNIERLLKINLKDTKVVAYQTKNSIENIGDTAWTETTGAPCIWMLDMFPPSEETTIVIPYNTKTEGNVATTDYFGQIPEDRVTLNEGVLYFKADGKSRGKLGINPVRATNVAGSYDAINSILTITLFDVDPEATYLNQEWKLEGDPLIGDAINAYNDGPLEDGSQMGPFYEIESVSPAAFLKPGETLTHDHAVFHFIGKAEALNAISESVLGVSLEKINNAL